MKTEKNSALLSELERLKLLPDKDSVINTSNQDVPLLTDVIGNQAADTEVERKTVAVINVDDASEASVSDDDTTSKLRHQLRTEGRRLIRAIIDEELTRVEHRLNQALSSHLEQLLDDLQPVAETPSSPWEQ